MNKISAEELEKLYTRSISAAQLLAECMQVNKFSRAEALNAMTYLVGKILHDSASEVGFQAFLKIVRRVYEKGLPE